MIIVAANPGNHPLMREAIGEVFRTTRHHRSERISDVARRAAHHIDTHQVCNLLPAAA